MSGIAHVVPADHRRREEFAGTPVAEYIAHHEAALWHAARLLGGYERAKLVDRLAEALRQSPRLNSRIRTMLDQVVALLALGHAHDPDRPETGFFAIIDPSDPAVDEICLLVDGLRDAIARSEALGREPAASEPRAA